MQLAPVPQAWRSAFLTASTWAGATATPDELTFALANYREEQSPDEAVAVLKHRRRLVSRGLLRVRRERDGHSAVAASDEEND